MLQSNLGVDNTWVKVTRMGWAKRLVSSA